MGSERLHPDLQRGRQQVNSFSNGPLVGNDPTGQPWTSPPQQAAGWPFQILPYIEQQSIQNLQAGMVRNMGMPIFVCPTRRGLVTFRSNVNNNGGRPLCYASPYFGPILSDPVGSNNTESTFFGIIVPSEPAAAGRAYSKDNPIRIAQITDGTSNTLAARREMAPPQPLSHWRLDGRPQFRQQPRPGYSADRRPGTAQGYEQPSLYGPARGRRRQ